MFTSKYRIIRVASPKNLVISTKVWADYIRTGNYVSFIRIYTF